MSATDSPEDNKIIRIITVCIPFGIGAIWVIVGAVLATMKEKRGVNRSYLNGTILACCGPKVPLNEDEDSRVSSQSMLHNESQVIRMEGLKLMRERGRILLILGVIFLLVGVLYMFLEMEYHKTTTLLGSAVKTVLVFILVIFSLIIINIRGRAIMKKINQKVLLLQRQEF